MADSLKRRDFIKSVSLAGVSIAMSEPVFTSGEERDEIRNDYFNVSFDRKKGIFNMQRSNGTPLLTGGTTCVNLSVRGEDMQTRKRSIATNKFKHMVRSSSFSDRLGTGKNLIIYGKARRKKPTLRFVYHCTINNR